MPRKSRIDVAGALHHVIARGIDRSKIFQDPTDKRNFIDRLADIIKATETRCFAWAIIPNHFHLILKTGNAPIATVMRRLLTGHALWYNRRHRGVVDICSKTDINRFYARKIPIFWNWYAIFISILYEPGWCEI